MERTDKIYINFDPEGDHCWCSDYAALTENVVETDNDEYREKHIEMYVRADLVDVLHERIAELEAENQEKELQLEEEGERNGRKGRRIAEQMVKIGALEDALRPAKELPPWRELVEYELIVQWAIDEVSIRHRGKEPRFVDTVDFLFDHSEIPALGEQLCSAFNRDLATGKKIK